MYLFSLFFVFSDMLISVNLFIINRISFNIIYIFILVLKWRALLLYICNIGSPNKH